MTKISLSILINFIAAAILCPLFIPLLKSLKARQSILEIGPNWHMGKSGTPTMGGIVFIVTIVMSTLFFVRDNATILVILAAVCFGFIGFFDDYIKIINKRNLGFSARAKFILQALVAIVFIAALRILGIVNDVVYFPFLKNGLNFGFFYIPIMVFIALASVNSVNLTDGIDGLASSVTVIVSLFLTAAAMMLKLSSMGIIAGAIIGALLGFLIYNFHPAKVFMGDTGSLFLGGLMIMISIVQKTPVFFIVAGAIYFIETISVIIQVTAYKLTGKRVFKMSPIHHHFEMTGYSEVKIVTVFCVVTLILSIFCFFALSFSI